MHPSNFVPANQPTPLIYIVQHQIEAYDESFGPDIWPREETGGRRRQLGSETGGTPEAKTKRRKRDTRIWRRYDVYVRETWTLCRCPSSSFRNYKIFIVTWLVILVIEGLVVPLGCPSL